MLPNWVTFSPKILRHESYFVPKKILKGESYFTKIAKIIVKSVAFKIENPLEMGPDLQKI